MPTCLRMLEQFLRRSYKSNRFSHDHSNKASTSGFRFMTIPFMGAFCLTPAGSEMLPNKPVAVWT